MLSLLMFLILYAMLIVITIISLYGGGAILQALFGIHIVVGCILTFIFFLIGIFIIIFIEKRIYKE